jgi:SPP1 family predicted phage head-tail adaptor
VSNPGRLDRRLALEAPVESDDGAGGVARSYEMVAALWAQVSPLAAHARADADSAGVVVTHRIVLRARPNITTRHRLRDGARLFRIVALREIAGGRFTEITAEERRD